MISEDFVFTSLVGGITALATACGYLYKRVEYFAVQTLNATNRNSHALEMLEKALAKNGVSRK